MRLCLCPVGGERQVREKRERTVDTKELTRSRQALCFRTRGDQRTDVAATQNVALHPHDREVGRWRIRGPVFSRLHVHSAELIASDASRHATAAENGHFPIVSESDSATVEKHGDVRVARRRRTSRVVAEREDPLVLQEEVALLGKEQAEPREVDLLLVGFDLREVSVVGEVGREIRRDAVLRIHADVGAGIVRLFRRRHIVGRQVGNRVGLQLERA